MRSYTKGEQYRFRSLARSFGLRYTQADTDPVIYMHMDSKKSINLLCNVEDSKVGMK